MWKPDSLRFDPEQAAVVLNDADDIVAAERAIAKAKGAESP